MVSFDYSQSCEKMLQQCKERSLFNAYLQLQRVVKLLTRNSCNANSESRVFLNSELFTSIVCHCEYIQMKKLKMQEEEFVCEKTICKTVTFFFQY